MAGDVSAARPPLPHRPRGASRNLKQREREVPDVDWGHALQHFASCISDELDELHTRFIQENVITFTVWKRMWREAKMSAAYHVEFWESTPTNTHKTIMQQTLDGLVWCIEDRGGEFGNAADVAALIGRIFALYCAYSVQLGTPKHKIDVDPQAWTALLSINCVMCGVGATLFPSAAREVRAMMHRLVVEENAFLRCLQGFGPSVRLHERALRTQDNVDTRYDSLLDSRPTSDEDLPVKKNTVERLKSLNDRYQEIMSQTSRASSTVGDRRAQTAVSSSLVPNTLPSGTESDGQELARALTNYLEYKANEDARRLNRAERAAAAREHENRIIAEVDHEERDEHINIVDLSDRGSVVSVPLSPMSESVASRRRLRSDSGGSEAFLAELESELHADITSDQIQPSAVQIPHPALLNHQNKRSSVFSEISEVDSDALADLEKELEQSARIVQSQPPKSQTKVSPPAQRKRGRNSSAIAEKATRTVPASAPKPSRVVKPRLAAQRARSESVGSCVSLMESWAASSTADSDGLAEIQAELDAIPSLPGPTQSATKSVSLPVDNHQKSSKIMRNSSILSSAKPRAKPSARQITGRKRKTVGAVEANDSVQIAVQPQEKRLRASSVVSDSSELMAQLQAELNFSAAPLSKATPSASSTQRPTPTVQPRLRRSSRLSSVGSEADSNALEELEKELQATAATLSPIQPTPQVQSSKLSRKQGVVPSKRSIQHTNAAQSTTKKPRINYADSPVVTGVHQPQGDHKSLNKSGKQQVLRRRPTAPRESSLISSKASDTESDGLAELVAELETSVTAKVLQEKPNPLPTRRATTCRKKLPASSKTEKPLLVSISSRALSRVPPAPAVTGLRRSSRLSSLASDTESDGLEDLMAELETAPASTSAIKSAAAITKKPRARAVKKQSTNSQVTKPKAKIKSKQTTKTKTSIAAASSLVIRTTRQAQTSKNRLPSGLTAAHPQVRQVPVPLSSSRRSTRSSSVAFDSDSDGLAELEAELQAGPS